MNEMFSLAWENEMEEYYFLKIILNISNTKYKSKGWISSLSKGILDWNFLNGFIYLLETMNKYRKSVFEIVIMKQSVKYRNQLLELRYDSF